MGLEGPALGFAQSVQLRPSAGDQEYDCTLDSEPVFPLAPIPIPIGDDGQISLFVSVKSGAGSTVTVTEAVTVGPQPDTDKV